MADTTIDSDPEEPGFVEGWLRDTESLRGEFELLPRTPPRTIDLSWTDE